MTQSDYLLISRGQWDETASPQDVQAAIDRFYAWYERGLADGVLKPGSRLEMRGKRVTRDAAMAKMFATEAAQKVIDDAVQICGGLGVKRGHPVERLYREVRALRIYEGATEVQKLIIARDLLKS